MDQPLSCGKDFSLLKTIVIKGLYLCIKKIRKKRNFPRVVFVLGTVEFRARVKRERRLEPNEYVVAQLGGTAISLLLVSVKSRYLKRHVWAF